MATKKATRKSPTTEKVATRKTTVKKAAPAKATTTVRTVSAKEATPVKRARRTLPETTVNVVLAELIGTFVLSLVFVMTANDMTPLYVGLTFAVLVMTLGAVSGAHLNPAVTFGLWSVKKVRAMMLPFYWAAQLLGAMAAVVVLSLVSGQQLGLDFSHFLNFDMSVFWVELVGTAVFLFVLTSIFNRVDLTSGNKALGAGLALFVGLIVAGSMFAPVSKAAETNYLKDLQSEASKTKSGSPDMAKLREVSVPNTILVGNATLNPAVALAATEATSADDVYARYGINDSAQTSKNTPSPYSRFSLEVIVATLIGAVVGASLTRLVGYSFKK
ncbi:MAG TPA: aquaporin [Patescibacteria group bacterium]|jgi:aquaporin Z|nr:aquaporin [Patescibacteria group bacterium]